MADENKDTEVAVEETSNKEQETKEETPTPAPAPVVEEKAAPVAEVKEEKKKEKEVEVPAKFKKIVEEIENMSVLELNELVKVFEEKFGVSATAVAAAGPAAGGEEAEEKTSATVELADAGANKIAVIKAVKEVLGLGLKEAKDLVDGAPTELKADMKMEEAEALKAKIEEAGGKVNLK